jgi:hypothetical protein
MAKFALRSIPILLLLTVPWMSSCSNDQISTEEPLALLLKGRAVAPAIVVDTTIEFYSLTEDGQRSLGSALADASGAFSTKVEGLLPTEPLLVCTGHGGKTIDSWSGKSFPMPQELPLCALFIVHDSLPEELLIIDPWSTLAYGLAQGYRAHGAKLGIANDSWSTVIPKAAERIATHLSPATPPDLGFIDPADPALEPLWVPSSRTASGLSAAALANLAATWPVDPSRAPLTMPELLHGLMADAQDGIFDGKTVTSDGISSEVVVGAGQLSANTLRYDLAKAIHQIVTQTEVTFADGIDAVALFNDRDGWYQQLSMDAGTLFPDQPPTLFDPIAPTILLGDGFPAEDSLVGTAELLNLEISATDPHGVEKLWLATPDEFADRTGLPGDDTTEMTLLIEFDPTQISSPKVFFRFMARDLTGNEATVDRTFRVALGSPAIKEVMPPSYLCLKEPPTEILVYATHPDGLDITVTMSSDSGPIVCQSQEDGYHHCPIELDDGAHITITATDPLGRTHEEPWQLCVDSIPPAILFDPAPNPEGETWYGPGNTTATVFVDELHAITLLSVLLNGVELDTSVKDEVVEVHLPATPDTEEATIDVTVKDDVGWETVASATYTYDDSPPEIQAPEGGIITNSFDLIKHKFRVVDGGSGVASVIIIGGVGIWSLNVDGIWYELVGTVDPKPGVPNSVTVEATDMVGNKSSRVFVLFLDSSTPSITQKTTFVIDDANEAPTYDADMEVVDYLQEGAEKVSLNAGSCADQCPPFAKFAPLLFGETVAEGMEQAVVSFSFEITDPCPTGAIKPTLSVEAGWYDGETLVYEPEPVAANCLGDTVTVPLLLPLSDEGVGVFPNDLVPDRLTLNVTDMGGQMASHVLFFDIAVRPPPLFFLDDATESPSDPIDLYMEPQSPQLHQALAGGTYYRRRLLNPTAVAAEVTLDSLPADSLLVAHARIYVQPEEPVGTACAVGLCRTIAQESDGECAAPLSFTIDTLYNDSNQQVRLRRVPLDGDPALLLPGNTFSLGAEEWVYLDLMSGAAQQPVDLQEPVKVALEDLSGQDVHLVSPEVWSAACTWNAGFPPEVSHYDLPDIVTGYALKIEPGESINFTVATQNSPDQTTLIVPVEPLLKTYTPPFPLPLSAW